MRELINGVPRDRYGVWCRHDEHIMVVDPDDDSEYPGCVPADPWPCDRCSYSDYLADAAIDEHAYYDERWNEWRS